MHKMLLVAAGGAIGALLRYGTGVSMTKLGMATPAATLAVNVVGSFLLGLLVFGAAFSGRIDENMVLLLGVGLLGSFTTMSTFACDALGMLHQEQTALFGLYVAGTVLLSLGGALLGRSAASVAFGG